ncbi:uncharacterized protein LOC130138642 [Syzygium oleosum]|uniref:uncharacterized protein LOC130138642 n=1 Tax=Syzygium oleosum TaxID=219896 RepID=UPI0024B91061|nr:uncharacterized protein LOC130138642 [Syzygium oleosum]
MPCQPACLLQAVVPPHLMPLRLLYPPPPPSSEVSGVKRVRCKNWSYPQCLVLEQSCPVLVHLHVRLIVCLASQYAAATIPTWRAWTHASSAAMASPSTSMAKRTVTSAPNSNLHINTHFIGRRNANMCRNFTWFKSLSILFGSHNLFVGALETSAWDDARQPPLPLPRQRPHHPPSTRGCLVALQDHPTYLIHKVPRHERYRNRSREELQDQGHGCPDYPEGLIDPQPRNNLRRLLHSLGLELQVLRIEQRREQRLGADLRKEPRELGQDGRGDAGAGRREGVCVVKPFHRQLRGILVLRLVGAMELGREF